MFTDITDLQKQVGAWAGKNFPNNKPYHALLGVGEEAGELFHAHLKLEQGIRGDKEKHHADAKDSVGDLVIYLCNYCCMMGYDLETILRQTWEEVSKRDWTKNKESGV